MLLYLHLKNLHRLLYFENPQYSSFLPGPICSSAIDAVCPECVWICSLIGPLMFPQTRTTQRRQGPLSRRPAAVMRQLTANQRAAPQTTSSHHPTIATHSPMAPRTGPNRPAVTAAMSSPPAETHRPIPTASQQRSGRISNQTPPKKRRRMTSRRRHARRARWPMSSRQRGGRVARGGGACSPSRRSTPTG